MYTAFRLHHAKPMDLVMLTQANLQGLRGQFDGTDWHCDLDDQFCWYTGVGTIGYSAGVIIREFSTECTMRSYRDALEEQRWQKRFWTLEARAAAKGDGSEPNNPPRVLAWDGWSLGYTPETMAHLRGEVLV